MRMKSVLEKTESGNLGHRKLEVIDVSDTFEGAELEAADIYCVEFEFKNGKKKKIEIIH